MFMVHFSSSFLNIDTAKQNKANKLWTTSADVDAIDKDDIVRTNSSTLNTPYKSGLTAAADGVCICSSSGPNYKTLLHIPISSSTLYIKNKVTGVWRSWIPLATATPPREFDVAVEACISAANCTCFKTQENVVHVYLRFTIMSIVTSGEIIATFPAGYRPNRYTEAILFYPIGVSLAGINTDGRIVVQRAPSGGLAIGAICMVAFPTYTAAF